MMLFIAGILTGIILCWVCYFFFPTTKRLFYQAYQALSDPEYLGIPFNDFDRLQLLRRNGYWLAFDTKLCAARWAVHKMNRLTITARLVERRPSFTMDYELEDQYRVSPKLYERQKWDRGHLVPCEDINYSTLSNRQTFLMTNVLPQHPELNRNAWKSLEHHIRLWVEVLGELHVVTGAFFGKRSRRLGGQVAIPKAFYKVIYSSSSHRAIAFFYPNQSLHARELWRDEYVMSMRALEDKLEEGEGVTYQFFGLLRPDARELIEDDCDLDYWLGLLSQRKKKR